MNNPYGVTRQMLEDLIITGVEGGIGYWSCIVDHDKGEGEFLSTSATQGGWLDIVEHPDPREHDGGDWVDENDEVLEVFRLDLDRAVAALPVFMDRAPNLFGDFLSGDYDVWAGDAFIQCALLGEVRYG